MSAQLPWVCGIHGLVTTGDCRRCEALDLALLEDAHRDQ